MKSLYNDETSNRSIFNILSFTVIIISCLGIFGISTLSTANRNKEISLRKVNGAKSKNIVFMIVKEYTIWVCIATIAAFPVAYYSMEYWLKNFAFRINSVWLIIIIAGFLSLILVVLTISWQTLRAANTNPKESLRYE